PFTAPARNSAIRACRHCGQSRLSGYPLHTSTPRSSTPCATRVRRTPGHWTRQGWLCDTPVTRASFTTSTASQARFRGRARYWPRSARRSGMRSTPPELEQRNSVRSEELDVRSDSAVADLDHIDQLREHRCSGEPRENIHAPVHGRFGAVDHQRDDLLVAELEGLDHDRKQGTIFAGANCGNRDWRRVARPSDLKPRVRGELLIDRRKVAAHARR